MKKIIRKINSNWFKLFLLLNNVSYGKGLLLKGVPYIHKTKKSEIIIGKNVTIRSSFLSNLIGLYSRSIIKTVKTGAMIKVGDNVGISGATIYSRKMIKIGDNTLIGGNVKILDNDFHPLRVDARNYMEDGKLKFVSDSISSKEIIIGDDCFIGCNAIILKGTRLGRGCVVGAGAVVSGVFPENSVIVGNPARVIRTIQQ